MARYVAQFAETFVHEVEFEAPEDADGGALAEIANQALQKLDLTGDREGSFELDSIDKQPPAPWVLRYGPIAETYTARFETKREAEAHASGVRMNGWVATVTEEAA